MKERLLLDAILEPGGLRPVFQPNFEFREKYFTLHSVEGLIRGPQGTHLETADILFEYVRRKGEEKVVDRACIKAIFEESKCVPQGVNLSINVHASTIGKDKDFPAFLCETAARNSIDMRRIIVEIVEYAPFWDGPSFAASLNQLRRSGVKIALDDIGLGQSTYRMLLDCLPDYFKIDRYIVKGSHADPFRQAVLESVLLLAHRFNARVVAEGVEMREDFETLIGLGIDLIQGFLLSLPISSEALSKADFSSISIVGAGSTSGIDRG